MTTDTVYYPPANWNATERDYPRQQCFAELFAAQVARTPDAIAAVCEDEQLTYQQLHQQATRLASTLQHRGVGPESLVALLAPRSLPFLTAVLATWQAGGAYLPLDPHHPPARLHHLLGHSRTRLVLVARACAPLLSAALADLPDATHIQVLILEDLTATQQAAGPLQAARLTAQSLAYVIYTSGSTGLPKGVMIEQGGMLNHLYAKIHTLQLGPTDRVAQTASQCFDISVWQFLAVLLIGGCVHILPDEVAHHPVYLLTHVEQQRLTILETVPSLLRAMLEAVESGQGDPPRLPHLRWLIPTGEALPPAFCQRWLRAYPHIPLLNAYGPTECSDDVTHFAISEPLPETQVHTPIGRPIQNLRLYILDAQMRPVPVGVSGELCVGGVGVGRGYLHDPQRTTEAFVPDPFSPEPGARLYKTGDLARYLPDGTIEFLGRLDYQVKMRGNRIELGEIEAVLAQHPAVHQVLVMAREDVPDDPRLIAYVVSHEQHAATIADLRTHARDHLPDYMIPSAFVLLETFPLTPNGKIDRRALPAPELTRPDLLAEYVTARTPLEETITAIWSRVLGITQVGIHDNFFALGGHSLLAMQILTQLRECFQADVPLERFLEGPTVAQLAEALQQAQATASPTGTRHGKTVLRPISRDTYRVHPYDIPRR